MERARRGGLPRGRAKRAVVRFGRQRVADRLPLAGGRACREGPPTSPAKRTPTGRGSSRQPTACASSYPAGYSTSSPSASSARPSRGPAYVWSSAFRRLAVSPLGDKGCSPGRLLAFVWPIDAAMGKRDTWGRSATGGCRTLRECAPAAGERTPAVLEAVRPPKGSTPCRIQHL